MGTLGLTVLGVFYLWEYERALSAVRQEFY